MKYIEFFIVSLLISVQAQAQITVMGSATASANTAYNVGTAQNSQVFNSDAGSTIYVDTPWSMSSPIPFTQHRIYRVNSIWQLDKVFIGANGPTITLISTSAGTNANPPCAWGNGITLTGSCDALTVRATTFTPDYISIPRLSATDISAIASPQKGMLVYDVTNDCLRCFNGSTWKKVVLTE